MRHPARTLGAVVYEAAIGAAGSPPVVAQDASTPLPAAACAR